MELVIHQDPAQRDATIREGFLSAIEPHRRELFGTAVRLTRSTSGGEDLLQDALARAWRFWHRFEQGTNARAWMHRILMNTFINGYRRKKREREILEEVHRLEVRRQADLHDDYVSSIAGLGDEVELALASLSEDFRQVIVRVDLHGQSYRDAADALGCPIGTVMSRLHRARRTLKSQLRDYATQEGYLAAAA